MLQTVRWSMRSHDASDKFALTTNAHDGFTDVIVTALDSDDAPSADLGLSGTAVLPDGSSQDFAFEQESPGRYRGKLPADAPGNYFLAVSDLGAAVCSALPSSIPATAEFERLTSNDGFLAEIAEGVPTDGEQGQLIRARRHRRYARPACHQRLPPWRLVCQKPQPDLAAAAFVRQRPLRRRRILPARRHTNRMDHALH